MQVSFSTQFLRNMQFLLQTTYCTASYQRTLRYFSVKNKTFIACFGHFSGPGDGEQVPSVLGCRRCSDLRAWTIQRLRGERRKNQGGEFSTTIHPSLPRKVTKGRHSYSILSKTTSLPEEGAAQHSGDHCLDQREEEEAALQAPTQPLTHTYARTQEKAVTLLRFSIFFSSLLNEKQISTLFADWSPSDRAVQSCSAHEALLSASQLLPLSPWCSGGHCILGVWSERRAPLGSCPSPHSRWSQPPQRPAGRRRWRSDIQPAVGRGGKINN